MVERRRSPRAPHVTQYESIKPEVSVVGISPHSRRRRRVPVAGYRRRALIDGGFETDILSSGEEALTLFRGRVKNYRALVTDVSLKGTMSGWDVARQVREIDPQCPVIYITGLAADEWSSRGVPNSVLLQKPFAPAQLVTAVSQLLNAGPANRVGNCPARTVPRRIDVAG